MIWLANTSSLLAFISLKTTREIVILSRRVCLLMNPLGHPIYSFQSTGQTREDQAVLTKIGFSGQPYACLCQPRELHLHNLAGPIHNNLGGRTRVGNGRLLLPRSLGLSTRVIGRTRGAPRSLLATSQSSLAHNQSRQYSADRSTSFHGQFQRARRFRVGATPMPLDRFQQGSLSSARSASLAGLCRRVLGTTTESIPGPLRQPLPRPRSLGPSMAPARLRSSATTGTAMTTATSSLAPQ